METFGRGTAYRSPIVPPTCPECRQSETVERVASLVAEAMTPATMTYARLPIVLTTARGYIATKRPTHGVAVGDVPEYLLPPREPQGLRYDVSRHATVIAALGVIGFALLLVGAVPSITANIVGDAVPTLPIALAGSILLAAALLYAAWGIMQLATGKARRRVRERMGAYRHATKRWNQLFYCTQCHCVFAPGSDRRIPHRHLHAYLSE